MVTKYHFLFFLFINFFYFQDLENSASSDAIVREKIARLPPDVSEVVHLEKLKSAKEGAELMEKVIIFTFLLQRVQNAGYSYEIQIQN